MTPSSQTTNNSFARDLVSVAQYYLRPRWVLLGIAIAAIAIGLTLNWSWLVAAGIAPILLAMLPCLVMCGLGLCMHKMVGASRSQGSQTANTLETTDDPKAAARMSANIPNCCQDGHDTTAPPYQTQSQTSQREGM